MQQSNNSNSSKDAPASASAIAVPSLDAPTVSNTKRLQGMVTKMGGQGDKVVGMSRALQRVSLNVG